MPDWGSAGATIDMAAKRFYEKYGFASLIDAELRLFLPVATLDDALLAS